ncbi:hypothetical protein KX00_1272 [Francisella sp. TX07-6608]|nr:hypothetical protein KX00_1272 [Francisella sp. TX07-6608]
MRKSRLSSYKQGKLIKLFIAGSTARSASKLVSANKTTASYFSIVKINVQALLKAMCFNALIKAGNLMA